jgi:uncharacterized repeat protein (TIGR03803 family)
MKKIIFLVLSIAGSGWVGQTVFAQTYTNLHVFAGPGDGAVPVGAFAISEGQLFGVTQAGGSGGAGVIYKMDFDGGNFSVCHNLDVNNYMDGENPQAGVTLADGILYGATYGDVADGNPGTIYSLNGNGTGYNPYPPLYPPKSTPNIQYPAGLTIASNIIYAVSSFGGSTAYEGSIFRMNLDQSNITNIYNFTDVPYPAQTNSDGANPRCTLVLIGNTLYGTAELGGAQGVGTLFSIQTDGLNFKVLHTFTGGTTDGSHPAATLALLGGTLYGTTYFGGTNGGNGSIFKINTNGTGYKLIYSFNGFSEGGYPTSGVIPVGNTLYGMSGNGGATIGGGGFLYSISTNGTAFKNLLNVSSNQGSTFYNSLVLTNTTLYGVASGGSPYTNGFAFAINLSSPAVSPALYTKISGTNLILTWPATSTGYTLYSGTNLNSIANWPIDPGNPAIVGGFYTVTNSLAGKQKFFRLAQ